MSGNVRTVMNTHTTHQIKSHHTKLADAVAASGMDLSYNPAEAKRTIAATDCHCSQAVVLDNGDVYYVYSADIDLLHKFEPFMSCLCDSPFEVAHIVGDEIRIDNNLRIPKTQAGRNWFKNRKQLGTLAA